MPKPTLKKRLKKQLKNDPYVWVIAYIEAKFLKYVESELTKYPEYADVEAYIPTVKILKKTFKNENFFEEVPLLFNYGFFKVPRKFAIYKDWLDNMSKNISCIYAWVRDPAQVLEKKPRLRLDNKTIPHRDGNITAAVATSEEISRLIRDSINLGAHSAEDIGLLNIGSPIVLRGYPFEGVHATVIEIDPKKEKVKVEIRIFDQMKEVMVSFDNVFFTIYHNKNYDDTIDAKNSIDSMMLNKTFDKLQKKNQDGNK